MRYRFDAADFLSVVLPADAVRPLVQQPFVDAAGVDEHDAEFRYRGLLPDSELTPSAASVEHAEANAAWPPRLASWPMDYNVLRDLGADEFRRENGTFDGRGVVIAHVERLPDVLAPELQTALDVHGRPVRKMLDILNHRTVEPTLSVRAARTDWQWVELGPPLTARDGRLSSDGDIYGAPESSGHYRLGFIEIPMSVLQPVNLPRDRGADSGQRKSRTFAVLWSDESKAVWLDLDDDKDFSNQTPVREFRSSGQVGILGVDDPVTPRRESRGYTVEKDGDYVGLSMNSSVHATMVAGLAAGSRGERGRVEGIAPGAQLISFNAGNTFSGFGWALVQAFSDSRSDVVLIEVSFPPMGDDYVKDGRSVLGLLTSRLSRRYPKPSFWTAGNGPEMSGIVDESVPAETVSVGVYDPSESLYAHYGMRLPWSGALHAIGSEGPAGNGALKPDLLAPSMMIAPRDGHLADDNHNVIPGLYQLPLGYMVSAGTSASTPIAAGAAALLVSGAKQRGLKHDAASMKRALIAAAEYLPEVGAYQQGAGVLRVGAAWQRLQSQAQDSAPLNIEIAAPVRTVNSEYLSTPNQGVGLFEREGWRVGDSARRRVTLVRRNGPAGALKLKTGWQGNADGTFKVDAEIALPLNRPTELEISIAPRKEGVHSATLQLMSDSRPDALVRIPVTIVVPYELNVGNGHALDLKVDLQIMGRAAVFVRVPPGVDALSVETVAQTSEGTALVMQDPTGRQHGFPQLLNRSASHTTETVPLPLPGVWGIFMRNSTGRTVFFKGLPEFVAHQNSDAPPPLKMNLRVTAAAASIDSGAGKASLAPDQPHTLTIDNAMAPLAQAQLSGRIAAVRVVQGNITRGERKIFDIDVRPGADLVMADLRPVGGQSLDADLYLFDCTGKCLLMRTSRGYEARGEVHVAYPRPGRWKLILDASTARGASMRYEYRDFYTLPDTGTVSVVDAPRDREAQARWTVPIRPWVAGPGVAGRDLAVLLYVHDPIHTSQLKGETVSEMAGCGNYPYCLTERREVAPLGLTLLPLR